jgi:uncharacterized phage-like protein YoqJ
MVKTANEKESCIEGKVESRYKMMQKAADYIMEHGKGNAVLFDKKFDAHLREFCVEDELSDLECKESIFEIKNNMVVSQL